MGLEVIELELTIIRGDGLAAKDTNIFGKLDELNRPS